MKSHFTQVIIASVLLARIATTQEATSQPTVQAVTSTTESAQRPQPCVIVAHEGSHAFRNIMLIGVAGAVISKERYKVIESNAAGLKVGEKMHGDELQARTHGTKVIVLRKTKETDLASAHNACSN